MKFNEVANHSMNSIGDSNNSTNAFDDSNDNSSIVGHPQQSSLNNPNVMPPVGSAGMVLNPEQQPVKIEKDLSTNKHQHGDGGGGGGGADHEIMDVLMNMSKIQWKNNSTTTAGSGGGKRYSCKLCEKSYKGKQGLDSHINSVHRGVKSFSCQLCHNKSYTQSHSLKQHIKTGGYIFYRYKHLIFHKNFIVHLNFIFFTVHEGVKAEKLYKCISCDKSYTQSHSLKHHIRLVHGGQFYECQWCDKAYSDYGRYRSHISIVHEGSKGLYRCEPCGKAYTQSHSLKNHIKSGGFFFYLIFHKTFN